MEKDIIYNKSCVLMDEIPDKSIRLIVTSPPYFNAKNYNHQDQIGRSSNSYEDYISSMDPVWRMFSSSKTKWKTVYQFTNITHG